MSDVLRSKVFIGTRDREIFNFLYQNKVASFQQIVERYFPDVKKKSAYSSVARLVEAKYLVKMARIEHGRPTIAFSLSDKCFRQFFHLEADSSMRKQFKSNSIEHDIALVDIQKRIRESSVFVSYLTENMLQSKSELLACLPVSDFIDLRTDAAFELSHKDKSYFLGLEYEASFKFSSRYRSKLLSYHSKPKIGIVIFVCANRQIVRSLMKVEKQYCSQFYSKIYYCTLDNLLNRNEKMTFFNIKNKSFIIP